MNIFTKRFSIRLTKEENSLLEKASKKHSVSKNKMLRALIAYSLKEVEKMFKTSKILEESYQSVGFQIQKIGIVLNQLNKNYYSGQNANIKELEEEIDKLWQCIKASKEALKVWQE